MVISRLSHTNFATSGSDRPAKNDFYSAFDKAVRFIESRGSNVRTSPKFQLDLIQQTFANKFFEQVNSSKKQPDRRVSLVDDLPVKKFPEIRDSSVLLETLFLKHRRFTLAENLSAQFEIGIIVHRTNFDTGLRPPTMTPDRAIQSYNSETLRVNMKRRQILPSVAI